MLFTDKTEAKRGKGRVLPMTEEELAYLMAQAKSRGISMVAVIRMCIRNTLVLDATNPAGTTDTQPVKNSHNGRKGKKNVES